MPPGFGAPLLAAKLDRLAQNAAFLLSLWDADIDITAADIRTRTAL